MSLVAAPETKLAPARLELIAGDGSFSGYASLFDRVDLAKDRVRRGAFRDSLVRRGISGIRMLWQHDAAEPIGVWLAMAEDERGLAVRGRLATDVARAREARALLKDGALDGLSIGFRTEKAHTDPKTGIRDLLAVDLWEVSLVTFPLLPEARVATPGRQAPAASLELASILWRAARRLRAINRTEKDRS
jgi:HK97 family phage prohead protease